MKSFDIYRIGKTDPFYTKEALIRRLRNMENEFLTVEVLEPVANYHTEEGQVPEHISRYMYPNGNWGQRRCFYLKELTDEELMEVLIPNGAIVKQDCSEVAQTFGYTPEILFIYSYKCSYIEENSF